MSVAGPLIKNGFSSKASLGGLTDSKLVELGIADSDVRKAVLGVTALKKSGGKGKQVSEVDYTVVAGLNLISLIARDPSEARLQSRTSETRGRESRI
jgi:hypothetical protein